VRLVTFSTLYPNAMSPNHGLFVEERVRKLVATSQVQARVVAPVAWFPFTHPRFGRFSAYARTPRREVRNGIEVSHPRFVAIPAIGTNVSPWLLARGALPEFLRLRAEGYDFDVIDAHYFYPDGVAAALLGRWLERPFTVTARGSDITMWPRFPLPRRMIRWAAWRAAAVGAVCEALKREIVALDVPDEHVRVLRNGVDLVKFRPGDRAAARARLGLTGRVLLSVGMLIPLKGHDLTLRALASLPGYTLLIAGTGVEERRLRELAASLGVTDRVRFLGAVPHAELPDYYSAADAMVLASSREGLANVLLESIACGTPVVATDVYGTREVIADPAAGALVTERTASAIAAAIERLFAALPDRSRTRAYAERFSWDSSTQAQLQMFRDVLMA
jgi:teichuronic acid biosynthesis glycosyltransferase TuaC